MGFIEHLQIETKINYSAALANQCDLRSATPTGSGAASDSEERCRPSTPSTHVKMGSNTSSVALRVVGNDEKGTQCLGI
jgi:hypothetical protein